MKGTQLLVMTSINVFIFPLRVLRRYYEKIQIKKFCFTINVIIVIINVIPQNLVSLQFLTQELHFCTNAELSLQRYLTEKNQVT